MQPLAQLPGAARTTWVGLRRDVQDAHLAGTDRDGTGAHQNIAEEDAASFRSRLGCHDAEHGPACGGRPEGIRVGHRNRAELRVGKHVDVIICRATCWNGVAVDADGVGAGGRICDRDRLLRVTVGRLANSGASRVQDKQVEVGLRI
jgi:hypothetical protein